jgi:hypothetical protein
MFENTFPYFYACATFFTVFAMVQFAKSGHLSSRSARFAGLLLMSSLVTLLMVGPLGLMLGGPSIVLSTLLASCVFEAAPQDKKKVVLPPPFNR